MTPPDPVARLVRRLCEQDAKDRGVQPPAWHGWQQRVRLPDHGKSRDVRCSCEEIAPTIRAALRLAAREVRDVGAGYLLQARGAPGRDTKARGYGGAAAASDAMARLTALARRPRRTR